MDQGVKEEMEKMTEYEELLKLKVYINMDLLACSKDRRGWCLFREYDRIFEWNNVKVV